VFCMLYAFFWVITRRTPGNYPKESIQHYATILILRFLFLDRNQLILPKQIATLWKSITGRITVNTIHHYLKKKTSACTNKHKMNHTFYLSTLKFTLKMP